MSAKMEFAHLEARSRRAGGGDAVAALGEPRLTDDLDVFVDPTLLEGMGIHAFIFCRQRWLA
jgi:hypothetical protein